ncbi:MAG: acyltransferase family protein [Planctomycetaceae bacterium]
MESTRGKPASLRAAGCAPVMRWHGLDTLRGVAALAVVLLHAGIPYMVAPMEHAVWPATDANPSPVVDALVWGVECFIMPLFFLLAGFFSAGLIVLLGPRKFLLHRTQRVLWPLVAAFAVILPPCVYLWALGWAADGKYVPTGYLRPGMPAELKADLWGLAHLWFLEYLYLYALGLCAAHGLRGPVSRNSAARGRASRWRRWFDRVLMSDWKPLLPAVPCAAILYYDPRIVLGFYQSYAPVASKLAYYAIFFFTGVVLYRHHRSLLIFARNSQNHLVTAAVTFAAMLPLIHDHIGTESTGWQRLAMAGLLALFAWSMAFGLFGLFARLKRGHNLATRYLAEASYWIYLIHLPLVALAQIALKPLAVPAFVKFSLAYGITVSLTLVSYDVLVRYTWLGEFLNGCRRKRPERGLPPRIPLPEAGVVAGREQIAEPLRKSA